jgi:hypothetical protein
VSQENIDVVLASIEAYNAEDLDAQMVTYAPDAVIVFDPRRLSFLVTASWDVRRLEMR